MTPIDVVVTGPESTGKTTIAARLAHLFDAALSAESARVYYDALLARDPSATLSFDDVAPIARGQIALEDRARADAESRGACCIVRDTDLISTVVYARHYYDDCPPWVVDAARDRRGALYLLCATDVPWIDDAVRDSAEERETLYAKFRDALDVFGCNVVTLHGDWNARERLAREAVGSLVQRTA